MKVFLDANILFSGSQSGSPVRLLLDRLQFHAVLMAHPGVVEEAKRNLSAKKPEWLGAFESLCAKLEISTRMGACPDVGLPAKDQPVLAAAVACASDFLLTGDRLHFGHLFGSTVAGVRVLSVREMAQEMINRGWMPKPDPEV